MDDFIEGFFPEVMREGKVPSLSVAVVQDGITKYTEGARLVVYPLSLSTVW